MYKTFTILLQTHQQAIQNLKCVQQEKNLRNTKELPKAPTPIRNIKRPSDLDLTSTYTCRKSFNHT